MVHSSLSATISRPLGLLWARAQMKKTPVHPAIKRRSTDEFFFLHPHLPPAFYARNPTVRPSEHTVTPITRKIDFLRFDVAVL